MTPEAEAEWLEWRRAGIGASDIARAATGRYGGAAAVVADKLGIDTGDTIDPALADRGHRWERPVADVVHAITGLYVAGEQLWLRHRTDDRWRCTPDGLLIPTPEASMADVVAGLEVKTTGPRAGAWDYYLAQCQWAMFVAGLPRWLLAVATIDQDYDVRTGQLTETATRIEVRWIDADPAEQARLVELGEWLWDHVQRGVLPEPAGPEALPAVKAANARPCTNCDGSGHVTNDDDIGAWSCVLCGASGWDAEPKATADIDDLAALIERREALAALIKAGDDERRTIEAQIRHRMGDAMEAVTSDGRWRVRCGAPVRKFTDRSEADFIDLYGTRAAELGLLRTSIDRDLAKQLMPDEYDALRVATPDRRLTVKDLQANHGD